MCLNYNVVANLFSEMNIVYLMIEKKRAVEKALLFSYVIEKNQFPVYVFFFTSTIFSMC